MEKYIKSDSLLQDRLSNGFLLLPFYRNKILFSLYGSESPKAIEDKKQSAFKRLRFLFNFSRFYIKNKEILIFSSTLFDIKTKDGIYFNNLHGFYKNCQPSKTLLIEDCDANGKWNAPNEDPDVSYIIAPLSFLCKVSAYLFSKFYKGKTIKADHLKENYPDVLSEREIRYVNCYSIITYKIFKFLFKRLSRLKLILLNCGSYGAELASIIKAAHDVGIKVAEPQHGMINDIHFVYNFEDFTFHCEEYKEYLPDYLLTFGEFWNTHSYIPVEKVIVGNPYMDKYRKDNDLYNKEKKGILFISQPTIRDVFTEIAFGLASKGVNDIKLRLHPFDKLTQEQEFQLLKAGVQISNYKAPLYDELAKASYVIGETSTCLYEALGLGGSIMIYENEETVKMYTGDDWMFIKTADDIISNLNNGHHNQKIDPEYYYVNNFSENYNKFLNDYIWK